MKSRVASHSLVATLSVLLLPAALAWAQWPLLPEMPPVGGEASPGAGAGFLGVVLVVLTLLVVLGLGVKTYDLKRTREAEAVHLQARISDSLFRERELCGPPITAIVRIPIWKGSPATIEIVGHVPSPEVHDAALRIVRVEAARTRPDFEIEDRLAVAPTRAADRKSVV